MGCGIGYGYLHRIPIDDYPPAASHTTASIPPTGYENIQKITSPTAMGAKPTTNHPPTPNVMPMVPPMMSSPVVGTMPPPPAVPASTIQLTSATSSLNSVTA